MKSASPPDPPGRPEPAARRNTWRPVVRTLHRDLGYFLVGLTIVYAVSGLAVNHTADWDPNFRSYQRVHELRRALPADDAAAVRAVQEALHLSGTATEVYRAGPSRLDFVLPGRRLHVNPQTGHVLEEGQAPRPFLRIFNWLHLVRGKQAWRNFADFYAVGLLFLALSGLFMLPGKKGVLGRGGLFVVAGIAVPLLYVLLSGGPGGH